MSSASGNDPQRLALAFPLFTIFARIPMLRNIISGLWIIVPMHRYILLLIFASLYFFTCIGVFWYGGTFRNMALHEEIRQANFNSFVNSAITLLQVFIGEGWNDIMTASVEAGYTIRGVLFFLAFVITETLLLTNLLVGILVNAYDAVDGLRKHVQRHGGKVSTRLMTFSRRICFKALSSPLLL